MIIGLALIPTNVLWVYLWMSIVSMSVFDLLHQPSWFGLDMLYVHGLMILSSAIKLDLDIKAYHNVLNSLRR